MIQNIYVPIADQWDWSGIMGELPAEPAPSKPKPTGVNTLDREPNLFDTKPKRGVSHKHWSGK